MTPLSWGSVKTPCLGGTRARIANFGAPPPLGPTLWSSVHLSCLSRRNHWLPALKSIVQSRCSSIRVSEAKALPAFRIGLETNHRATIVPLAIIVRLRPSFLHPGFHPLLIPYLSLVLLDFRKPAAAACRFEPCVPRARRSSVSSYLGELEQRFRCESPQAETYLDGKAVAVGQKAP